MTRWEIVLAGDDRDMLVVHEPDRVTMPSTGVLISEAGGMRRRLIPWRLIDEVVEIEDGQ